MQEGFRYYTFDKGLEHEEELQNDCILFVLKGSLRFSYNEFQFTISAGKMVFVCRESLFSTYSLEKCEVVVALFEGGVWPCQKISFSELSYLRDIIEYRMEPLEIKDRLYRFLELLECYLKDGANCIHFHEIKIKELFWNMRFYYSKRELASFFYMVIGRSQGFRNMVLNNYKNVKQWKNWLRFVVFLFPLSKDSLRRNSEKHQPDGCRNSWCVKSSTNFRLQTCRSEVLFTNWTFHL